MNKQDFLSQLKKGLSGLKKQEREERLTFYRDMIEDRMEEGLLEEAAVAECGSVEKILSQIMGEVKQTGEKSRRKLSAWAIVLLVLGSPVWLSLLLSAFAVLVSLAAALWSAVISCWAVFVSLAGGAVGALAVSIGCFAGQSLWEGLALLGAALLCAGLGIFAFFGCKAVTKAGAWLTKKIAIALKNCFAKKEEAA